MVRAHPEWSDREHGYEHGDTIVSVDPAYVEHGASATLRRVGIEPTAANAFAVSVDYGGGYGGHEHLASFGDRTDAWEFAHAVTWYLAAQNGTVRCAVDAVTGTADPHDDSWTPDGVIEDLDPVEVLRKMAGYRSQALEDELEEYDEQW